MGPSNLSDTSQYVCVDAMYVSGYTRECQRTTLNLAQLLNCSIEANLDSKAFLQVAVAARRHRSN